MDEIHAQPQQQLEGGSQSQQRIQQDTSSGYYYPGYMADNNINNNDNGHISHHGHQTNMQRHQEDNIFVDSGHIEDEEAEELNLQQQEMNQQYGKGGEGEEEEAEVVEEDRPSREAPPTPIDDNTLFGLPVVVSEIYGSSYVSPEQNI